MKTVIQNKNGGIIITISYLSFNTPTFATNLIIVESKSNDLVKKQVDDVCGTLKIK